MNNSTNSASTGAPLVPQASILITGATGNIGTELVKLFAEQGVAFRAMVRSAKDFDALNARPNVETIIGDFDDTASLDRVLNGVESAFLLTPSSERAEAQQLAFVAAAQRAGVRHIVKLSQLAADEDSPVRFLRYHAVVEQAIRDSGIAYTFLRPNLFMQGLLGFRSTIVEQGKFFASIGDARISAIDIRDIAAVAAAALTTDGHKDKTYTLTGPAALTHADMADGLAAALHKSVTFVDVPPATLREALLVAGFPIWQADGLIEDYAHYSRNEALMLTPDVAQVTGKLPRTFADFAVDYASAFS